MFDRVRRASGFRLVALLMLPLAPSITVMANGVESMKLISDQVGWVANSDDLYWTADAGNHWEIRTPQSAIKEAIEDVFFLDEFTGWALLAHSDENDYVQYDLATTESGGRSWQISHIEIPNEATRDFSGHGSIHFIDRQHGWVDLEVSSGSSFRPGQLLATSDAGVNWDYPTGQPGAMGALCFFDAQDGILTGGPEDTEVYVTHDGSRSWQTLLLDGRKALPAEVATYGAPVCNGNQGSLPVTYSGGDRVKSAFIMFQTINAGRTYSPSVVLKDLADTSPGQRITSAVVGSTLLALDVPTGSALRLTSMSAKERQNRQSGESGQSSIALIGASFVDSLHGWALTSAGILSTTDGGITWRNITPAGVPGHIAEGTLVTAPDVAETSATQSMPPEEAAGLPFSPTTTKNTRMGFDKSLVPGVSVMQAWWNSSPYYEIGIYPPGAVNRKTQDSLNINLLGSNGPLTISALAHQGWGIIPLWVGLQAPCVTPQNNISFTRFSALPAEAVTQGRKEADKAASKTKNLSSQLPRIIYFDFEPYNPADPKTGQGCSVAVQAFLSGWVSEMHAMGYKAGVYGTPPEAAAEFSQVKPLPDDVWIHATVVATVNPKISIWGLTSQGVTLCDPFAKNTCKPTSNTTLWLNSKRIHQYVDNNNQTYGGQTLKIDGDVIDADVAISNATAKPYSFKYVVINCSNLTTQNFQPLAINNAGDVVGYYFASNFTTHGFKYSKGKCTGLPDPPGTNPSPNPSGINDAGQIAGQYSSGIPGTENYYFVYDPAKASPYTSIAIQNFNRQSLGFNDNGQLVGTRGTGLSGVSGFEYNLNRGGESTAINCTSCDINGLNGDGYAVGYLESNQTNFIYSLVSKKLTAVAAVNSFGGINDNLQILGGNVLFDYPTGTAISLANTGPPKQTMYTIGINDYAEIIATSTNNATGVGQALILCPVGFPTCPAPIH